MHHSMPIMLYCGETINHRGSAMIPSDRALATSYRLSIVAMSLSVVVWPQFSMKSFKL